MRLPVFILILALALTGTSFAQVGDAEAEFRVARRLVSEGSPQAVAALERVVELDPSGPLADDALLELALLVDLPAWPEELGRLTTAELGAAAKILKRIVKDHAAGDRAAEAAYRLTLLQLEPLAQRDAEKARLQLLSLAAGTGPESHRARYALAWMAEHRGDLARAEAAYQRLRVDVPWSDAARRATFAVGRIRLRQSRATEAAARLQEAVLDGSFAPALQARAGALRDVAVDAVRGRVATREALRATAANRPSTLAANATGGALIGSRKYSTVIEFDGRGAEVDRWSVEQPLDVLLSPNGSRYAVTLATVFRLEPGGGTTVVGRPGALGSFLGGAVDDLGRIWVLDRKGERIGLIESGSETPEVLWSGGGTRLSALTWDGNRLLALDARARSVVAISVTGEPAGVVAAELDRPTALAVDPAGRLAVLCTKGTQVRFLTADGASLSDFAIVGAGMQRASDLALGTDGSLQLVEDATGLRWVGR